MKTTIIISLLTLLLSLSSLGQTTPDVTKYRITAYKSGNTQITSTSNEVTTVPDIQLYIPNAFTPNNDGLNDEFGAIGEGVEDYHLTIYNRWGEKIFESNDLAVKWNGTYKGELVELGTYSYSLAAKGLKKKHFYKSGTVTVVL